MKHFLLLFSLACAAIQLGGPSQADGHGFAGARFFRDPYHRRSICRG